MTDYQRAVKALPETGGVYAVWNGAQLLYIGKSKNVRKRFRFHNLRRKFKELGANAVTVLVIEDPIQRHDIEAMLIFKWKPLLAVAGVKYGPAWLFTEYASASDKQKQSRRASFVLCS